MIIHLIYSKHVTSQVNNDHLLSFAFSITTWCWAYRSSWTYTQNTCFGSSFLKVFLDRVHLAYSWKFLSELIIFQLHIELSKRKLNSLAIFPTTLSNLMYFKNDGLFHFQKTKIIIGCFVGITIFCALLLIVFYKVCGALWCQVNFHLKFHYDLFYRYEEKHHQHMNGKLKKPSLGIQ